MADVVKQAKEILQAAGGAVDRAGGANGKK